ncbi:MAG: hypothetical protein KatS3mg039_0137 [Candidatus Kapaibacterium sp.]|nr:MAG: hypothetical protein KatS3mg039_0137 [Candidatus Kapabacteria bacterium]
MVHAGKRTYFVDVDTEPSGERIVFLNESHGEGKERHQVLVFEEDLPRVIEAMRAAQEYIEKHPPSPVQG